MLGTKAPWIGAKGSFKDPRWATANTVPWAYLEYEPLDIAGNPTQPPQRNVFEPPIQALTIGAAQAADDIKATTNVYDASLGAQSNETSGVAIQQRQGQMELSNFHFVDNLNRAILQCGVVLCDLIPKIYDTPREVRILGEDMQEQIVKVNQQFTDDKGVPKCYDLANGKYDVRMKIGPSFKTQQEKTSQQLMQMAQNYPQILQVAGDIIFDNLNFAGADKIAERLRRSMPPALTDDPSKKPAELLAQQNQQQAQQIEQMTAMLNKLNEDLRHQGRRGRIQSAHRADEDRVERPPGGAQGASRPDQGGNAGDLGPEHRGAAGADSHGRNAGARHGIRGRGAGRGTAGTGSGDGGAGDAAAGRATRADGRHCRHSGRSSAVNATGDGMTIAGRSPCPTPHSF